METPGGPDRFVASSAEVSEQAVLDWLARWPDQAEGYRILAEYHRAWAEAIAASDLPKEQVPPPYELPEPPLPAASTSAGEAIIWAELGAQPPETAEQPDDEASVRLLEEWLTRWPDQKMATDALFGHLQEWFFKTGRKAADFSLEQAINEFALYGDVRELPDPPRNSAGSD